jgi:Uma2 family endonuclease
MTYERREQVLSGGRLKAAPELAIEIISPGAENRRRDRVVKRNLYAKYGVEEYWIVDPKARASEIYNLEEISLALSAKCTATDTLTSSALPGFSCQVEQVFADVD